MRRTVMTALALLTLGGSAATAQDRPWRLVAEVATTRYSVAFRDSSTPPLEGTAWRPRMYSLRLLGHLGRVDLGLGIGIAGADLGAGEGTGVIVIFEDAYTLVEIAPEVRFPVITTSTGAEIALHLGPVLDLWSGDGAAGRSVLGGQGGVTAGLPVTRRLRADLRLDATLTGSFVSDEEVGPDLIRDDSLWRTRLGLGLAWSL